MFPYSPSFFLIGQKTVLCDNFYVLTENQPGFLKSFFSFFHFSSALGPVASPPFPATISELFFFYSADFFPTPSSQNPRNLRVGD